MKLEGTMLTFSFGGESYTVNIKAVLEALFDFVGKILATYAPEVNDAFDKVADEL